MISLQKAGQHQTHKSQNNSSDNVNGLVPQLSLTYFFDHPPTKAVEEKMGKLMQEHADIKAEIQGFTDNTGKATSNERLSGVRAKNRRVVASFK